MPKQFNLEGQRFGKLIVQYRQGTKNGNAMWACLCDCGCDTVASTTRLRNGEKKDCGCSRRKENPKTELLQIRLTLEEKEAIQELSKKTGLSMTQLIANAIESYGEVA